MKPKHLAYRLYIAVFVCGAATMVLELVGSRVLAPFLGTSIIIWASLIGIVLASLSLGYWFGGRWADRSPSAANLSKAILFAGFYIGLMAVIQLPVLTFATAAPIDLRIKALLSVLILFFPTNVALGMVPPMTVRLTIQDAENSGRTSGTVSSLSTVGSIVGTFLAGFVLISTLGSTRILFLTAMTLVFVSWLVFPIGLKKTKGAAVLLFLFALSLSSSAGKALSAAGVADIDTNYNHVRIHEAPHPDTGRTSRLLTTGVFPNGTKGTYLVAQSAVYPDDPEELLTPYLRVFRVAENFNPGLRRGLLIGGGGFTFAGDFIRRNGSARLDVVEIDPRLVDIARQYFGFRDDPRIAVFHEDGRPFLSRTKNEYDAIYVDAFNSAGTIAYNLTTKEAVRSIFDGLTDNGVALVNMVSGIEGDSGKFFRAELRTYKSVFPRIIVIPISDPADPALVQNVVLVALKNPEARLLTDPDAEIQGYLDNEWRKPVEEDLPVLTDDFAPVDQYTLPIYFQS